MRTLAAVLLSLACASREIPAPVPVAVRTEVAQSRALVAAPHGAQPAAAEDAACTSDADCAVTRVPAGACCPSLCEPRVVSAKAAAALDAQASSCRPACAEPQCAPQRTVVAPSCQSGRCTALNQLPR